MTPTYGPAFQFYSGDWLGSERVSLMTFEEEGVYIRLLAYCWRHGSIPSDPQRLTFLLGKGASTTLAATVSTMFQQDPNDSTRLIHDRLDAEREKQRLWREKSSKGGKKSADERKKKKSRVVQPPLVPPKAPKGQPNGNTSSSSSSLDSEEPKTSCDDPSDDHENVFTCDPEINPNMQKAFNVAMTLGFGILKNNPDNRSFREEKKRPKTAALWADDIEKLNRIDNYSWKQIEYCVEWSQQERFYKTIILSGSNLRKHFDAMVVKIKAEKEAPKSDKSSNWGAEHELN